LAGGVEALSEMLSKNPILHTIEEALTEAPIRESATEVEDDRDTPGLPPIDRTDRCSKTAECERLRRRRRAARQAMFDEIRALFDAGSIVRQDPLGGHRASLISSGAKAA
jgi:hypothetical protein